MVTNFPGRVKEICNVAGIQSITCKSNTWGEGEEGKIIKQL